MTITEYILFARTESIDGNGPISELRRYVVEQLWMAFYDPPEYFWTPDLTVEELRELLAYYPPENIRAFEQVAADYARHVAGDPQTVPVPPRYGLDEPIPFSLEVMPNEENRSIFRVAGLYCGS